MVGWAILPTLILSIVSLVHPIYSDRYVSASAPGVALLAAFACVRAFPEVLDPTRISNGTADRRREFESRASSARQQPFSW